MVGRYCLAVYSSMKSHHKMRHLRGVCGLLVQAGVLLAMGNAALAHAQVALPLAPAGGTLPAADSAAPAPNGAPAPSFVLQGITFKGNTAFSDADLQKLVADQIGQRVTFAQVKQLAERISAAYRAADYLLTDTVVPAQQVDGGTIELSVLEGRLGRIRIERIDDVPVAEARIAAIAGQLPTGRALTQHQLERAMLLLSDTPGMATQASLEAGDQAGTYDLLIEAKAAPRTSVSADLDNQGSASTGRYRAGILGRINSPFGIGDNLDVRLLSSLGKGLLFGRLAYELPVGESGLRASLAAGHIAYALGANFAPLDAHGSADVVELGATYPLLRSRGHNLFSKAGVETKRLNDHIDAVDKLSTKHIVSLNAGLIYERRDQLFGGGFVSGALDVVRGHLDLGSAQDRALDQGASGRQTQGAYVRVTYQLSRLQAIARDLTAYLAVAGQWANRNLDSAEKISGGGPRAVRAFSGSTGIGDQAMILNAELRWSLKADATLSAFYDIGRVRANHDPAAGEDNRITLRGPGIGLYKIVATGTALRATLGWPDVQRGAPAMPREHGVRVYAQLVKTF